jgi:hypothetical protein
MQFVQFFQVEDCRCLQEIEIIFAGITKIGDVAKEGGTPVIVLADTAVEQQVVPPSERARAFCGLRSHGHLPKSQRKTGEPFRSANFSDVMLFRSAPQGVWCAVDIGAAVGDVHNAIGQRGWLFPKGTAPARELGLGAIREGGFRRMTARVFPK